jgi:hypothetical protein
MSKSLFSCSKVNRNREAKWWFGKTYARLNSRQKEHINQYLLSNRRSTAESKMNKLTSI